jgi:hypothetical protein
MARPVAGWSRLLHLLLPGCWWRKRQGSADATYEGRATTSQLRPSQRVALPSRNASLLVSQVCLRSLVAVRDSSVGSSDFACRKTAIPMTIVRPSVEPREPSGGDEPNLHSARSGRVCEVPRCDSRPVIVGVIGASAAQCPRKTRRAQPALATGASRGPRSGSPWCGPARHGGIRSRARTRTGHPCGRRTRYRPG